MDDYSMQMSWVSTNSARPLRYGYGPRGSPAFPPSFSWPIRFEAGEPVGTATLVYREIEPTSAAECQRVMRKNVPPVIGDPPSLEIESYSGLGEVYFFVPRYEAEDCVTAAVGEVRLTISQARTRRTTLISDQCGLVRKRGGRGRRWRLLGRTDRSTGRFEMKFKDRRRSTGRRVFRYRLSFRGKTLRKGKFAIKTRYRRGYRIWEGRDAFVNVCINDNRTIYSSGGRLYCNEPSSVGRRIRLLKR